MIVANGSPKTGTHLLLKAIIILGRFDVLHRHIPHPSFIKNHFHIKRNPRNVLVSWVRYMEQDPTKENLIKAMPLVIDDMKSYSGWLSDKNTLNVSFENLLTDESEFQKIADRLNVNLPSNALKDLWGATETFTGKLSNWREHWDDELEFAWIKHGGVELEVLFGYSKDDPIKIRKAK